jgi:DNA-binding CsgD family transcriptional regulator
MVWLAGDTSARIIVDGLHNLLWGNPLAEALLDSRPGVEIRGGVLVVIDPSRQPGLRDFVQGAGSAPTSFCLVHPRGDGWLLIRCQRVEAVGPSLFCLSLRVAGAADMDASYQHLDEAFVLTKAEHRVLRDLLAGNEAESLSALHGVSIETTRSHIKSIYAKVGVTSRERLFARVQGFRA